MTQEKLRELLLQYFENSISKSDCKELLNYLDAVDHQEIAPVIDELLLSLPDTHRLERTDSDAIYNAIHSDPRFSEIDKTVYRWGGISKRWYFVAATVFLFISVGLLYFKSRDTEQDTKTVATRSKSSIAIKPGSKKATLTLPDGEVIDLEAQNQGMLHVNSNANIRKVKSGQIVYQSGQPSDSDPGNRNKLSFNDLKTPKGGEYQITLVDGTRVWLNSASSLRFPSAFSGGKRQVILSGEAYFEVAKNAAMPFVVSIGQTEIKVLGTHFNVSGYNDDDITTTTLLEGSVQLINGKNKRILNPGQQAAVSKTLGGIQISRGDIAQAMAWKNGYFRFDDQDIRGIMKQVSRWYDVEVEFKGKEMNNKQFGGTFYRSKGIAELLSHLEQLDNNIHFKIIGRRIEIME